MMTSHRGVLPLARVQPVIRGAFAIGPDAEQGTEGVERVEAAVKSERKLVQVGLKVLRADGAVMRSVEPCLQVRKDKVNDRQELFGHLGIIAFHNWQVIISAL